MEVGPVACKFGSALTCREESELGRGLPDLLRKPLSEHLLREEAAW